MSSWALLLALTGQQSDSSSNQLAFDPVFEASTEDDLIRAFWSNGQAWGIFTQQKNSNTAEITVLGSIDSD
jgi:hypothetical protein